MRILLLACLSSSLLATAASTSFAGLVISTPRGLNPGDHFRIVFVTTGTTDATSKNISTYDAFVNTDANGATYNGSVISWQAIASTASVDAINHIGTTGDAVYRADGTKVTSSDDSSGLWSGSLLHAPNDYLSGTSATGATVFTGTTAFGHSSFELGNLGDVTIGISNNNASDWVSHYYDVPTASHNLYGISSDLVVPGATAVPEPSTAVLAGLGALAGLAYSFARNRK